MSPDVAKCPAVENPWTMEERARSDRTLGLLRAALPRFIRLPPLPVRSPASHKRFPRVCVAHADGVEAENRDRRPRSCVYLSLSPASYFAAPRQRLWLLPLHSPHTLRTVGPQRIPVGFDFVIIASRHLRLALVEEELGRWTRSFSKQNLRHGVS